MAKSLGARFLLERSVRPAAGGANTVISFSLSICSQAVIFLITITSYFFDPPLHLDQLGALFSRKADTPSCASSVS